MRYPIKIIVFFTCVLLFNLNITAQVFNKQQAFNADMLMNPANTGNHNYEWRLYNYFQHSGLIGGNGFNSFFLGGEYQIHTFPSKISLGAYYISEDLSSSPVMVNHFFASSSFHKPINNHVLHLGVQLGIINYGLDQNRLTFPDQYDRNEGGFNPLLPTQELLEIKGKTLPNLNVGLAYSHRMYKREIEMGLALFNLIPGEPPIAYDDSKFRGNLHAKVSFLSENYKLSPYALFSYLASGYQVGLGGFYEYFIPGEKFQFRSLVAGAEFGLKTQDNPQYFALSGGLQWSKIMAVFKYQYPFSVSGNTSPSFNSFQLSLVFNGFNANIDEFVHPCNLF